MFLKVLKNPGMPEPPIFVIFGSGSRQGQIQAPLPTGTPCPRRLPTTHRPRLCPPTPRPHTPFCRPPPRHRPVTTTPTRPRRPRHPTTHCSRTPTPKKNTMEIKKTLGFLKITYFTVE